MLFLNNPKTWAMKSLTTYSNKKISMIKDNSSHHLKSNKILISTPPLQSFTISAMNRSLPNISTESFYPAPKSENSSLSPPLKAKIKMPLSPSIKKHKLILPIWAKETDPKKIPIDSKFSGKINCTLMF